MNSRHTKEPVSHALGNERVKEEPRRNTSQNNHRRYIIVMESWGNPKNKSRCLIIQLQMKYKNNKNALVALALSIKTNCLLFLY